MLSDSPPDRDVIWSDERVQGASRFVQRLWRLVNESAEIAKAAPGGAAGVVRRRGAGAAQGGPWRAGQGLERDRAAAFQRLPRPYPRIHQCAGRRAGASEGSRPRTLAWAVREAAVILVQLFAPMMPHLAEECWTVLGQTGLISEADWPQIERDLLVEDTVTLVVQVNGKKRGDVTVPRGAQNPEIEAAVLALDAVKLGAGRQGRPQGDYCSHEDRECRWLGPGSPLGCSPWPPWRR